LIASQNNHTPQNIEQKVPIGAIGGLTLSLVIPIGLYFPILN